LPVEIEKLDRIYPASHNLGGPWLETLPLFLSIGQQRQQPGFSNRLQSPDR